MEESSSFVFNFYANRVDRRHPIQNHRHTTTNVCAVLNERTTRQICNCKIVVIAELLLIFTWFHEMKWKKKRKTVRFKILIKYYSLVGIRTASAFVHSVFRFPQTPTDKPQASNSPSTYIREAANTRHFALIFHESVSPCESPCVFSARGIHVACLMSWIRREREYVTKACVCVLHCTPHGAERRQIRQRRRQRMEKWKVKNAFRLEFSISFVSENINALKTCAAYFKMNLLYLRLGICETLGCHALIRIVQEHSTHVYFSDSFETSSILLLHCDSAENARSEQSRWWRRTFAVENAPIPIYVLFEVSQRL